MASHEHRRGCHLAQPSHARTLGLRKDSFMLPSPFWGVQPVPAPRDQGTTCRFLARDSRRRQPANSYVTEVVRLRLFVTEGRRSDRSDRSDSGSRTARTRSDEKALADGATGVTARQQFDSRRASGADRRKAARKGFARTPLRHTGFTTMRGVRILSRSLSKRSVKQTIPQLRQSLDEVSRLLLGEAVPHDHLKNSPSTCSWRTVRRRSAGKHIARAS